MSRVLRAALSVILVVVGCLATVAASSRAVDHFYLPGPGGVAQEATNVVAGGVFATVVAGLAAFALLVWAIGWGCRRQGPRAVWWLAPAALTLISIVAAVSALAMPQLSY